MGYRILVVDDEPDLSESICEYLERLGHRAEPLLNGAELDRALIRGAADLVLLDLRLPGESGHEILARLRRDHDLAVILLSGHAGLVDRISALEMGADDVLAKPVDLRELAARIEVSLRGRLPRQSAVMRFENASADLALARLLRDDGRIERLDAGEVALLRAFQRRPEEVLSRADLLSEAPAGRDDALERSINNRISRLRAKIGTEAIKTVHGGGYRYDPVRPRPGA